MPKGKRSGSNVNILTDPKTAGLLQEIKKLLVLQLVKGTTPATPDEIGGALGVTGRSIRNIATTSKQRRRRKKSVNKKRA